MVLVLNVGSQTFKWKLFGDQGTVVEQGKSENDPKACYDLLAKDGKIQLVAHRLVHGGQKYFEPVVLTDEKVTYLNEISYLAPLHNPPAIKTISKARELAPKIPHLAVFDTGFFKDLPLYAKLYAVPYEWYEKFGIVRYGFHGISHEYAAREAAQQLSRPVETIKLITVHLGAGCSVTAIAGGRAVDTSMGYTPLEGLVMSTRSGDIDPAIIRRIHEKFGLSLAEIDESLHTKSGLLGISGATGDMRELLTRSDQRSLLALDIFIHRIRKYIGAYMAILGGVDAVVMTGAIGSGSEYIRNRVATGLDIFGDFVFLTVETNEELMIYQKVLPFLQST